MKVIEAMNELKLTEKKLRAKQDFIKKFAARPSFREDAFDGKQKDRVQEAVQACMDLIRQHEQLKRDIDFTNLTSNVDVDGKPFTLHSLILHKRQLCKLKRGVFKSLDDSQAEYDISELRKGRSEQKVTAQVVHNYDVQERENKLIEVDELESKIDSALQIANSKIDLAKAPVVK